MTAAVERRLFLQWLLLNVAFVIGLIVLGLTYGGKLHGPALVTIPIILALGAYATAYGGRLCWEAGGEFIGETPVARNIVHRATYLDHWAWVCPMVGILSSIAGMAILISNNDPATLGNRIASGGGAIFYATFVGVLVSVILKHEQRMIEHELTGD